MHTRTGHLDQELNMANTAPETYGTICDVWIVSVPLKTEFKLLFLSTPPSIKGRGYWNFWWIPACWKV